MSAENAAFFLFLALVFGYFWFRPKDRRGKWDEFD